MPRASLSLKVFAFYLCFLCASLIFAPNVFLRAFGVPETSEAWIRVVGVLAGVLGYYYLFAVRAGLREFAQQTVFVRAAVLPTFAGLVVFAGAPVPLILFGVVDLAGALWTHVALRRDLAASPTPA